MVKSRGLTLIELMITLVIVAIVLSLGLVTLRGYIPKQRLTASKTALTNLIQRAQAEANARSYWTCIKLTQQGDFILAELFADVNETHAPTEKGNDDACGDSDGDGDRKITSATLKRGVEMNSCGNKNVTPDCVLWFDTAGSPQVCTGSCPDQNAGNICVDDDIQIVLSNPDLGSNTRAQEIEVMRGGLVNTPKIGDQGLATDLWAAAPTPSLSVGNAGACE